MQFKNAQIILKTLRFGDKSMGYWKWWIKKYSFDIMFILFFCLLPLALFFGFALMLIFLPENAIIIFCLILLFLVVIGFAYSTYSSYKKFKDESNDLVLNPKKW